MKIRGIKKLVSIGPDELSESDLSLTYDAPYVGKVEAALFVYSYRDGGYDGSGCAVWTTGKSSGKTWAYTDLGHCSCNGPTQYVREADLAKFTLREVKEILKKDGGEHQLKVLEYLNKRV